MLGLTTTKVLREEIAKVTKMFQGKLDEANRKLAVASLFIGDMATKLDEFREAREIKVVSVTKARQAAAQLIAFADATDMQIRELNTAIAVGEEVAANQATITTVEVPEIVAVLLEG